MGESNLRDELEKVWVPKDVGELEGLLLTIQNESGKKILKHKIQQILRKRSIAGNWSDWDDLRRPDRNNQEWTNWNKWPDWTNSPEWTNWNNQEWPNWSDNRG